MKKKIAWILAGFWIVIGWFLCVVLFQTSRMKNSAQEPRPKIAVSGYVPYTFVKQLTGNKADILMLLPTGAEPHSFEPTPGALVQLHEAAAFIYMSDRLEPWAADLAKALPKSTRVLVLDQTVISEDPHIWMDVSKVPLLIREIAQLLFEIMPQNRAQIERNLSKFKKEIDVLQTSFAASLPACRQKEAVHIGHLAFANLLAPYGITLTALSGTSHEGEHSVKKVVKLVKLIKDKDIKVVFTEDTLSPRLSQMIARETEVQLLPLYSIEDISKTDFEHQVTYTELMRRNLDSLVRGLQCPAS